MISKTAKLIITLLLLTGTLFQTACNNEIPPPQPQSWFMLAIIHFPATVPVDFEAVSIQGDYKPSTGLLRIQGANANARDKIEITIRKTVDGVLGTYEIGEFGSSASAARAEYIDATSEWDARSSSGSITITKFEEATTEKTYLVSGTYTFKANADGGELEITNGEIKNAILLED